MGTASPAANVRNGSKPDGKFGWKQAKPVVVIDDFSGSLEHILEIAEELAPYLAIPITTRALDASSRPADTAANAYAERLASARAVHRRRLRHRRLRSPRSSFSMVTLKPTELTPPQRAPAFRHDRPEAARFAALLRAPPNSGTAFLTASAQRVSSERPN